MALESVKKALDYVVGQTNDQQLGRIRRHLDAVNALAEPTRALTDDALRAKTQEFKDRLARGETRLGIRAEAFAVAREAAERTVGMRPFDVQIVGAVALDDRRIAEMQTGEGKTLVATLPAYLNALVARVHVVTVNDYLARRDREWMGPIYEFLGISVGLLQEQMGTEDRKVAYSADITYGTNTQFGFDYLRDNMVLTKDQKVQGPLDYAIIDEIDNILIDEARTPLIISGPSSGSIDRYGKFASLGRTFKKDRDFEVDEETHRLTLSDEGIRRGEEGLSIENLYADDSDTREALHDLENALRALHMFRKEKDYIVKDGRVMIVDEFTGRLMPDRRYSDGLHQALEAKEGLLVQRESQTFAQITLQHYFRLYKGICGMTGTAKTEEDEFKEIYGLRVLVIPPNRALIREVKPDAMFRSEKAKFEAIADDVEKLHEIDRPVLIGTNSIEKSERLSGLLKVRGLPHQVLNAKHHEREAEIIKDAGQRGAITVATNMAGRGTDIRLGEGIAQIGGLHVIGSQRHEARRIDDQLLGRAGRQGDPGSSQFYLSLEEDLLRVFGGDRLGALLDRLGMEEGQAIEHGLLTSAIRRAQKRVEGRNFEIRKHLVQYDLILAKQREAIYTLRDRFLLPPRGLADTPTGEDENLDDYLLGLFEEYSSGLVASHADRSRPKEEWDLEGLGRELSLFLPIASDTLAEKSPEELSKLATEHLESALRKQKESIGAQFPLAARFVILSLTDESWLDHLYTLDDLREGIGLNAYGGTDPLVAFKRESFVLFQDMLGRSARRIVQALLDPNLKRKLEAPQAAAPSRQVQYVHPGAGDSTQVRPNPEKRRPVETAKRPGRNDPCPCGSGKKYKNCCGEND